jgi:hypothetical protein
MKPHGNMILIGALDNIRMRTCTYLKDGGIRRREVSLGFEDKEKTKFFNESVVNLKMCGFVFLDILQYLVAREGRMHEGLNGCISKG